MPQGPLVAIVDDDVSIRRATQNLLRAAGFSAATFGSAEDFLGSRRRGEVSCLLADMRMPGMTGLELHRALAAAGEIIPTVLITAYLDESLHQQARDAGIVCCLSKPFSPERLCECVRSALAAAPVPKS